MLTVTTELATAHWVGPALPAARCWGNKQESSPNLPGESDTESKTGLTPCLPFSTHPCTFFTGRLQDKGKSFHSE